MSEPTVGRTGLTQSQLTAMGVTRRNVRRTAWRLALRGELAGLTKQEKAQEVLNEIASENPTAFANVGFDWMALIELILEFLPLIIALF